MLNPAAGGTSNKIKALRDPEIPPTAGFRVTDWDFLRDISLGWCYLSP